MIGFVQEVIYTNLFVLQIKTDNYSFNLVQVNNSNLKCL